MRPSGRELPIRVSTNDVEVLPTEQTTVDRVVIIGAGPAGLTAAYELVKHGRRPLVIEQDRHHVGGLARTVQFKAFRFDIGGHRFFSKSQEIEQLWEEICGEDFIRRPRRSRIFYREKFFDYPLKAGNALQGLGMVEGIACVLSYLRFAVFPRRPEVSFEDWVVNRFGRRLFDIFFRTYTEKVWGIPCGEISADWASQRIKSLSLAEAIFAAVLPRRNHTNGKVIKTLIDSFRYPRLGAGMMWELARDRIVKAGGTIEMGKSVTTIRHDGRRVLEVDVECPNHAPQSIPGAYFISSMPLRDLIQRWTPAPPADVLKAARQLKYRDLIVIAILVRRPDLFTDNWIYIHDPRVRVGRIQNFRAWSPDMVPDPTLCCLGLEYFCNRGDPLWTMADPDLVHLATSELENIGLVRAAEVEDGVVVRASKAYPVYDEQYQTHVRLIRQYLELGFPNIQVVGRNGMHKYNNQDHSMMTALLAARNILGARFDVWKVNTDAEYQEEETSMSGSARESVLLPAHRG